jgi:hypothetical protein
MAYESEKFRSELFHFFFNILKWLWKLLSHSNSDYQVKFQHGKMFCRAKVIHVHLYRKIEEK